MLLHTFEVVGSRRILLFLDTQAYFLRSYQLSLYPLHSIPLKLIYIVLGFLVW
jgi:hypothetical protein